MKTIAIAFKDLKQSFRSAFALMFMLVVPLLMTGMFYLMFDGQSGAPDEAAVELPATRLVVANLDRGDAHLTAGWLGGADAQGGADALGGADTLGDVLVNALQQPGMEQWVTVSVAGSAGEAREQVDVQAADAALIIPPDFSTNFTYGEKPAEASFYAGQDPAAGVVIVKGMVEQVLDSFAGMRIAVDMAGSSADEAAEAAARYGEHLAQAQDPANLIAAREPAAVEAARSGSEGSPLARMIGPVMGGMLIFFAFFTGGNTAQSILKEDEQGTLARLLSTPTWPSTILRGKFLAVGLTVLTQVTVLLAAARLVFGIQWGALVPAGLAAVGITACAAAFGIFAASLLKTTRQSGAVFGGLFTVTGMLGMFPIFTGGSGGVEIISLLTPQGWAVRGLTLAMNGGGALEAAANLLVLLALSAAFLAAGAWKFQRRYG